MPLNSNSILAGSSAYPAQWSDWRFWVVLATAFACYFGFTSWSSKRRRRALSQLAPSMNFSWLDAMPETPRGIAFLRPGLGGEFSNAMTGIGAGCEVTVFDFEYETGTMLMPMTERTHVQTIAAFRSSHSVLPAFQFGPESVMRKMYTVGSEQFKFETALPSVSAPAGHYLLRSHEQTANALFDSEMLKFFNDLGLQHQPWFLEGNQEWQLIWQHNNIVSPQNYPWFLQQTSAIAAMVFGCATMKRGATPQIPGGASQ
jgi:hypothetical protein